MTTFNFSNFVVDKSEILGESQHPKNIVKYLSEDRKVSEGAMIPFKMGKIVCCIWIWVTHRFVCYHHYSISMLVYCTISLITDWTVYTEKYKAQGPDV